MAIVDASLAVELVSPSASRASIVARLFGRWAATDESLHAPAMLPLETLNALLTGIRRRRWDGAAADASAIRAASLPIMLHDEQRDRTRAWELARRYDNYQIYDMLYVALAERLGEPLVTIDDKLYRRLTHLGWVLRPADVLA